MRLLLITFFLICINFIGFSQENDPYRELDFPSIMVIPYQSNYFESDVNLSGRLFRRKPRGFVQINAGEYFKRYLELALTDKLLTYFEVNRISYYKNKDAEEDLQKIYQSVNYTSHKNRIRKYYKNYGYFSISEVLRIGSYRWGYDCYHEHAGKPVWKMRKIPFTDVSISDSTLLPYLNSKYKCSYYLFINQVDMYSRFKICSDLTKNVQQKDIVLHYSLIDASGEKITGGLVAVTYNPGNGRNSILEVVEKNIEVLASLIQTNLEEQLGLQLQTIR